MSDNGTGNTAHNATDDPNGDTTANTIGNTTDNTTGSTGGDRTGGAPPGTASPTAPPARLIHAVQEVEEFAHRGGWDRPRQIFALVPTAELLAHEPGLIGQLGRDADHDSGDIGDDDAAGDFAESDGALTPVEQGDLPGDGLGDALAQIAWPPQVAGCALVLEIVAETDQAHHEGRLAVGVLRDDPAAVCLLRWRHDPDAPLTRSPDLAPELIAALRSTFEA